MERFLVEGGEKLRGEADVSGAKNSSLPILAATLLGGGKTILHNCPNLSDVDAAVEILTYLGCKINRNGNTLIINSDFVNQSEIPEKLMHEMRSSIVFLGAIISRMSKAKLSFPGGCELGPRPIDLHIQSLKKLGVKINEQYGIIDCEVDTKGIIGTKITLSFPSVGATENIMLASVMAKGETIIHNAAQEPEIVDLANYLISRGAKIKDAGKSTVIISGVDKLNDAEYSVMPDRIVAISYMSAVAITGGDILLNKLNPNDIESVIPVFEQVGCKLNIYKDKILLSSPNKIEPIKSIRTMPYPGFPTDAQAPIMALMTVANGTSVFVENIFESRYKHVSELVKMGSDIKVEGKVAIIRGVDRLYGTTVESTDLRGGASLLIAALAASGKTKIEQIHHIDRGYENIENILSSLGAKITREKYEI